MIPNSFNFNSQNSLENWGIKIIKYDTLMPQKRANKIMIPGQDGMYDYGSENWEERIIRVYCRWYNDKQVPTRHTMREVAYWLSKKGKLTFWDEPDKYYIAQIYEPAEVINLAQTNIKEFELEFVCEPFAYSQSKLTQLKLGSNKLSYNGTVKTPCLLTIKNIGDTDIQNITIRTTRKVD